MKEDDAPTARLLLLKTCTEFNLWGKDKKINGFELFFIM